MKRAVVQFGFFVGVGILVTYWVYVQMVWAWFHKTGGSDQLPWYVAFFFRNDPEFKEVKNRDLLGDWVRMMRERIGRH